MNIAINAHDAKKELDAILYRLLRRTQPPHTVRHWHDGQNCSEATGLSIQRFLSGSQGGDQQIAARIARTKSIYSVFPRSPAPSYMSPTKPICFACAMCIIFRLQTNIATAEALIHSLDRGDLLLDIVNPKALILVCWSPIPLLS